MMTRLAVATLALICTSAVAQAQSGPWLDANGQPYVASAPQPSPGDYMQRGMGRQSMAQQASLPSADLVQPEANFRDEYGNLYNSRGDRIGGRVPHRIVKTH